MEKKKYKDDSTKWALWSHPVLKFMVLGLQVVSFCHVYVPFSAVLLSPPWKMSMYTHTHSPSIKVWCTERPCPPHSCHYLKIQSSVLNSSPFLFLIFPSFVFKGLFYNVFFGTDETPFFPLTGRICMIPEQIDIVLKSKYPSKWFFCLSLVPYTVPST